MSADPKLTATLREALKKPMFFAFIAKGNEGSLLADKKTISARETADAKKEFGGGTIFKGRCVGENGTLVFEVAKEPPGTLAALIKKTIKENAGLTYPVEIRVASDLLEEGESESESGTPTHEEPSAKPAPTPPDPAALKFVTKVKALAQVVQKVEATGADVTAAKHEIAEANKLYIAKQYDQANAGLDKAEALLKQALTPTAKPDESGAAHFVARLKALAPVVQKVEATGAEAANAVKHQIAEANKLYVAKQYDQANAALDKAEALIKQAFQAAPKPTETKTPSGDAQLQAAWESRVTALEPLVLDAQKTRPNDAKWMTMFMMVQDLGSEGKYADALKVAERLEGLLAQKGTAAPSATRGELVAYRKSLLRWRSAKETVRKNIVQLQASALKDFPDKVTEIKKLDGILANLNEGLGDLLDAALNASKDEERAPLHAAAIDLIDEYRKFVGTSPLVKHADDNPWMRVDVEKTLSGALAEMAGHLEA